VIWEGASVINFDRFLDHAQINGSEALQRVQANWAKVD